MLFKRKFPVGLHKNLLTLLAKLKEPVILEYISEKPLRYPLKASENLFSLFLDLPAYEPFSVILK